MARIHLTHKATTREIRNGARKAIGAIDELLADRRVVLDHIEIMHEHAVPAADIGRVALVEMPGGNETLTITIKLRRGAKLK